MLKLVRVVVSGLLFCWMAWTTDWSAVHDTFATVNVSFWLIAVGLLVVAQLASIARWRMFAFQLGMDRTYWQLARYNFIGMYFNLFLPTSVGGDVARIWYLNANSGRKFSATAAVVLDRMSGVTALIVVAVLAVLFGPPDTPSWVRRWVFGIALAGVCASTGLVAVNHMRWLPKARMVQFAVIRKAVIRPRAVVVTTTISLAVQLSSAAIVWLIGQSVNADIPFGYCAVFVPMVSLLLLLPFSINGVGLREWGCALFLAPLGVSHSLAFTLAWLWLAAQVAVSMLGVIGVYVEPESAASMAAAAK